MNLVSDDGMLLPFLTIYYTCELVCIYDVQAEISEITTC